MATPRFPYADLKDFLAALEHAGELHRVRAAVDPTLEISEIVTRTVRAKGPALLFERPTRGDMPVAINLFGTHRRMAMALGVDDVNEIGERIGELVKPELPVGWAGIRDGLGKLMQLKSVPPKRVEVGALPGGRLQGIRRRPGPAARAADLARRRRRLPQLRADPHQAPGDRQAQPRACTGCSSTRRHARACTGRSTRTPPPTTRWPSGSASGCRWRSRSGATPSCRTAASAPLPGDIDEYLFAGFLRGERVEMVDCLTVPLQVPANAQVVLEGYVEPGERAPEGPFGDHTGFYTRSSRSRCCTSSA